MLVLENIEHSMEAYESEKNILEKQIYVEEWVDV